MGVIDSQMGELKQLQPEHMVSAGSANVHFSTMSRGPQRELKMHYFQLKGFNLTEPAVFLFLLVVTAWWEESKYWKVGVYEWSRQGNAVPSEVTGKGVKIQENEISCA